MAFPNDGTYVIKKEYFDEEISAVLIESRQARKHMRKLGKVTETVAACRLRKIKILQAVEKLATWRRTYGYDRDDSWMHGTRPLAPEESTASLWEEVNALEQAISMSGRARPWQKTKELLAAIKRYVERHSREAEQVTVTPVSTVQHCIPRSPPPEIPSDACVCVDMEEKEEEGRMNPEPRELESPSAGTGLETPGQQCPPNGETGRTTADGCLLVGMGSDQGGDTSSPTERVNTRTDSKITTAPSAPNTTLLQARRKPNDKKTLSEENRRYDSGGKGEKPLPWNAAVMVLFSFSGGNIGPWDARCLCLVCFRLFVPV